MSSSSGSSKKGPGRPPLLGSPTGTNNPSPAVSSASLTASSMASSMPFPSLAGASGLGGLNSNLLSSLSLGQFDPKTNPLLLPFGGMSNMSALSSMGGLGGLGNMNLFANLAGLGIPGLTAGMDALTGNTSGGADAQASSSNSGNVKNSSKSRKSTSDNNLNQGSSGNKQSSSLSQNSNSLPTTSPFPFFFPNPSLLYTPLGLGGLNPFTLQPGMSSAYDSLAQQCGLLNGTLGAAAAAAAAAGNNASPNSTSRSGKSGNSSSRSGSATAVTSTTTTSSSSSSKHRTNPSSSRDQSAPLQQLLLPHDAHILESISRVAGSLDVAAVAAASKQAKNDKKEEKRKTLDSLSRAALLSEFSPVEKLKSSKRDFLGHLGSPADLSKFMELPCSSPLSSSSSSSKRNREQEMKEALEQLSKTPTEYIARSLSSVEERLSNKRPRESKEMAENLSMMLSKDENIEQPLPPTKKMKIDLPICTAVESSSNPSSAPQTSTAPIIPTPIESVAVDIEALLTPTTVVKGSAMTTTDIEEKILATTSHYNITTEVANTSTNSGQSSESSDELKATSSHASPGAATAKDVDSSESGENSKKGGASGSSSNSGGRRTRGKRKSGELDPEAPVIERKNLRSSAGRAAAAAAARQAAAKLQEAQAAAKLLEAAEEAAKEDADS